MDDEDARMFMKVYEGWFRHWRRWLKLQECHRVLHHHCRRRRRSIVGIATAV
jgi:hypothetical protein